MNLNGQSARPIPSSHLQTPMFQNFNLQRSSAKYIYVWRRRSTCPTFAYMAPEFAGPVIVSREPGVVRELRPFNTFSNNIHSKIFPGAELTSRVPWAPQEGGGMVSGRGGELGPDFWKFKNHPLAWLFNKVSVVTGDSEELLGPDAGMFAYSGSEFASWEILF